MDDWLDVGWGQNASEGLSVARVLVRVKNSPGSLAAVMTVIANNGGNIFNMKVQERNPLFFEFIMDIEVRDVAHLQNILRCATGEWLNAVESVDRVREAEASITMAGQIVTPVASFAGELRRRVESRSL